MLGNAKTNRFLLSTATVMLGARANLHLLNPSDHSIGLVKNFVLQSDPQNVILTQGLRNAAVMSVRNSEGLRCSMEVYEYTAKNLAYAAGLNGGSGYNLIATDFPTAGSTAPGATTVVVTGDASTAIPADSWMYMQDTITDVVHIAKVTSSVYSSPNTTITITGYPTPTGVTYAAGSVVGRVRKVDVGAAEVQPDLCAKVVGLMPKDNKPFVILFPKIQISKGLGVSFQAENFSNMPFEFTPYAQVSGDATYAIHGDAIAVLFAAGG